MPGITVRPSRSNTFVPLGIFRSLPTSTISSERISIVALSNTNLFLFIVKMRTLVRAISDSGLAISYVNARSVFDSFLFPFNISKSDFS